VLADCNRPCPGGTHRAAAATPLEPSGSPLRLFPQTLRVMIMAPPTNAYIVRPNCVVTGPSSCRLPSIDSQRAGERSGRGLTLASPRACGPLRTLVGLGFRGSGPATGRTGDRRLTGQRPVVVRPWARPEHPAPFIDALRDRGPGPAIAHGKMAVDLDPCLPGISLSRPPIDEGRAGRVCATSRTAMARSR